jgi:uncharacterized protein (DUF58 family)
LRQEASQAQGGWAGWHHDAAIVAASLPALLVEASAIAHNVAPGWHGRRRAGTGETFWQYRRFTHGDLPSRIDWRRSARDEHLYIREQEWEAAHTIWLWPDRSPSMAFHSDLSTHSKERDAIVMALALGEILVRGGERVAVPGLTRPTGGSRATRHLAEAIGRDDSATHGGLPPKEQLSAHSDYVLFSDFLAPLEETEARIQAIVAQGIRCHLVQILDPAEETFPYSGRVEFFSPQGDARFLTGRAENLHERYRARLFAHREGLRDLARRISGSFTLHHTDKPPHTALLALHAVLSAPRDGPARAPASPARPGGTPLRLVAGHGDG